MWKRLAAALLALMAIPSPVTAQAVIQQAPPEENVVATVRAPDGKLRVDFTLNGEGRAGYKVSREGRPIIAESHFGFLFADQPQLLRNFELVGTKASSVDTRWEQPWGEYRTIRDRHEGLVATFREKTGSHRRMVVEMRVFADAVAFRYRFEKGAGDVTRIGEELTQFRLAQDGRAWWAPAFESNREEYLNERTAISAVGTAQTPFTMVLADGTHVSIHEAALVDYSGMNVARATGTDFKAVLTPSMSGPKVVRTGAFTTPWRVIMIAPDAPGLYRSAQAILNLNEPNRLGDVSWVRPMKYAGIWWGMHLDQQTWNSGPKHGATTANTRAMIDFAAENGLGGVLVEGWNIGWDGDWFGTGWDYSFTKPYPDYDLVGLAAYAKSKGVVLIGHHETGGNAANYEAQMADAFALDRKLGIPAVKTGYVADAGGMQVRGPDGKIRFEWHEGQASAQHHLNVVREAAKHRVAIDAHEPIKDTGLRRTYPNWVSREGQRGMEYNAWGSPKNPPEWESEFFFGRMLGGPFDFTPGVVSLKGKGDSWILATVAKQLASYIVVYSPIQMVPDLPENYRANPRALDFIRKVAVDWDDTKVLSGKVGEHVVVARKTRGKDEWFVGGVTDRQARDVAVDLSFLEPGRAYSLEIWRDGPTAHYGDARGYDMAYETKTVRAGDRLPVHIAPGGGFAIRLTPTR